MTAKTFIFIPAGSYLTLLAVKFNFLVKGDKSGFLYFNGRFNLISWRWKKLKRARLIENCRSNK